MAPLTTNPAAFARSMLDVRLYDQQNRLLTAVANHRRIAVKACHSSGKTYVLACLVLWFLTRWPDAKVITTSSAYEQVRRQLWPEIDAIARHSRIAFPAVREAHMMLSRQNFAIGVSVDTPVRLQGHHSGHVLIIVDESNGIADPIYESIDSLMASGDVTLVAVGNPVIPEGWWFRVFEDELPGWQRLTIGAFDTPNLLGMDSETVAAMAPADLDVIVHPHLISRRWARETLDEHGATSPYYRARVLAMFPDVDAINAVFRMSDVRAAAADASEPSAAKLRAGIDVAAGGGDETAMYVLRGSQVLRMETWLGTEAEEECAIVLGEMGGPDAFEYVAIDAVGVGAYFGSNFLDAYQVIRFMAGRSAWQPSVFANRRAELTWGLRGALRDRQLTGVKDGRTHRQCRDLRYEFTSTGQIRIEPKAVAKSQRGVESPDRMEALMLANGPHWIE